jgi:microcystin-dependent protein
VRKTRVSFSEATAGGSLYILTNAQAATQTLFPTSTAGGGATHNNMPPYLTLNYIIKT